MKPVFMMMVGLPGSGKSTWANKYAESSDDETVVLSSDSIRQQLFPNKDNFLPKHNTIVFNHMLKLTKEYLSKGISVVYDATNLNKRRRMHVLRELDQKRICCCKICTLVVASVETCLEQNSKRESSVPKEVIYRMRTQFQPPHISEGWDYVYISCAWRTNGDRFSYYNLHQKELTFAQENSHHDFTLFEHQVKTQNYVLSRSNDSELIIAARYHDIGKLWTKTKDISGECHYYNHHSVGAYEFIVYAVTMVDTLPPGLSMTPVTPSILNISNYIYYHMHPWQTWDRFSKTRQKDKQILGEAMFAKIMLLSEADQHSQKKMEDKIDETM